MLDRETYNAFFDIVQTTPADGNLAHYRTVAKWSERLYNHYIAIGKPRRAKAELASFNHWRRRNAQAIQRNRRIRQANLAKEEWQHNHDYWNLHGKRYEPDIIGPIRGDNEDPREFQARLISYYKAGNPPLFRGHEQLEPEFLHLWKEHVHDKYLPKYERQLY